MLSWAFQILRCIFFQHLIIKPLMELSLKTQSPKSNSRLKEYAGILIKSYKRSNQIFFITLRCKIIHLARS